MAVQIPPSENIPFEAQILMGGDYGSLQEKGEHNKVNFFQALFPPLFHEKYLPIPFLFLFLFFSLIHIFSPGKQVKY